jgi:hypothetical protein
MGEDRFLRGLFLLIYVYYFLLIKFFSGRIESDLSFKKRFDEIAEIFSIFCVARPL